jgi:hypothetical protein
MRTYLIQDAICLVDKAKKLVESGERLCEGEVKALEVLMGQTQVLRNQMVLHDLLAGQSGKDVAVKYNLSAARVSQIKRAANI